MRTQLDCLPCFVRQGLDSARFAEPDVEVQAQIMRGVLTAAAELDWNQPPVATAQVIHRRIRELCRVDDPYREVKHQYNQLVLGLLPELSELVTTAPDPVAMAARYAIAANVIDFGASTALDPGEVRSALRGVLSEPFHEDLLAFHTALDQARDVLYLADNAGEIAADRLLIEQIGPERVTVVVRGAPVINDATMADAVEVGLTELVEVIDNGSDAPGTLWEDCSEALRLRFQAADLIIAKGQGNYESLSEVAAPLFFLFKVKCALVAANCGHPLGTHLLLRSPNHPDRQSDTPVPAVVLGDEPVARPQNHPDGSPPSTRTDPVPASATAPLPSSTHSPSRKVFR